MYSKTTWHINTFKRRDLRQEGFSIKSVCYLFVTSYCRSVPESGTIVIVYWCIYYFSASLNALGTLREGDSSTFFTTTTDRRDKSPGRPLLMLSHCLPTPVTGVQSLPATGHFLFSLLRQADLHFWFHITSVSRKAAISNLNKQIHYSISQYTPGVFTRSHPRSSIILYFHACIYLRIRFLPYSRYSRFKRTHCYFLGEENLKWQHFGL